ncbi:PREDICTED: eukaryotic translation initiation factor 4 gamma 1-like [Papilio xuthus]|uniref:Eukaryotic translation initiation factor 4 gamma 1-like n=1 Tax=Papilio xuthus TaxID=66420 RepID=A0AAJ6Z242_PAPXU|nr:PREDICTED: eukaryotic translation initiation factor 4 gamma 1-like [Papilio xuthus]
MPTATELHSTDIEKCSQETALTKGSEEGKQAITTERQTKLSQSISDCEDTLSSMKDINLNDTPDYQQYHQPIHLSLSGNESEDCLDQNQDMSSADEDSKVPRPEDINMKSAPMIPKLKYKYDNDQWSPLNQSGRKCYDIRLLMQIKDDPLSKTKPIGVHLELSSIVKQYQEPQPFNPVLRPINDSLFPNFAKNISIAPRNTTPRDPKKDNRNINTSSREVSVKMTSSPGRPAAPAPAPAPAPAREPVIRVSLAREEVQLSQTKNAWKPSRLKNAALSEEERKTQELYATFRGILNKLTPQKFDTLVGKVRALQIDTRATLAGVIDLVFDKAVDEPDFAETYANLCHCLAALKVPSDSGSPDQYVNFRLLIISKCQKQFVTDKVDDNVLRIEGELNDCTDTMKKKELQLLLDEENRKVRMRSVGNVRFIGELYKLKMLTAKIMVFCMNYLLDKQEEEKLECLCKLLTTIGEQVESEVKEPLDAVFKRMQNIVDRRGGGGAGGGAGGGGGGGALSSRVRFMLQDVIALRRRRWAPRAAVHHAQPTTMDRIQREADLHHRNIEVTPPPTHTHLTDNFLPHTCCNATNAYFM